MLASLHLGPDNRSYDHEEITTDTRTTPLPVGDDEQYIEYHDREWGVPVHDDRTLFEFLILEGHRRA